MTPHLVHCSTSFSNSDVLSQPSTFISPSGVVELKYRYALNLDIGVQRQGLDRNATA